MRLSLAQRREKEIEGDLRVHAWTPAGFVSAGLLHLEEDGERISASFSYDQDYLDAALSYPLDPINMPLKPGGVATTSQFVRLGAIFDAAPDAWGRRVVTAQIPEDARRRVLRNAFLRGADGIGAIVLTPQSMTAPGDLQHIVEWSLQERPALSQVHLAARAARALERGVSVTDEMRHMLSGSWTIGGARPKAILRDDRPGSIAGQSLIAKFDSTSDVVPRNRIEAACLDMAADMGFSVPWHDLVDLEDGTTALLLERFDREVRDGKVHRRHYVSALSLASYEPQSRFLDSAMDRAVLSWGKLLELASRVCARPHAARVEMFARLALNAAFRNTDDHLKNFAFLKMADSALHYEIAPVFDVSSQNAQRHYLHCAGLGQVYSLQEVIPLARNFGVSKAAATEIEERIVQVMESAANYLDARGMAREEREQVLEWVRDGLGHRYSAHTPTASVNRQAP